MGELGPFFYILIGIDISKNAFISGAARAGDGNERSARVCGAGVKASEASADRAAGSREGRLANLGILLTSRYHFHFLHLLDLSISIRSASGSSLHGTLAARNNGCKLTAIQPRRICATVTDTGLLAVRHQNSVYPNSAAMSSILRVLFRKK